MRRKKAGIWMIRLSASAWEVSRPERRTIPPRSPDGFYSGNTDPLARIDEATYGDELREDYYAWEWGDALFVVIDPFQYTMNLPYTPAAGEGTDDAVTGNQWSWTLGEQQFNWFKQTTRKQQCQIQVCLFPSDGWRDTKSDQWGRSGLRTRWCRGGRDILSGEEKTQTVLGICASARGCSGLGTTQSTS